MNLQQISETAILIPSYKPDEKLAPYVSALAEAGYGHIIIVDDGSGEEYRAVFDGIEQNDQVHIISYLPNHGKGYALREGMRYLQDCCPDCEYIITADSDGQHTVPDTLRMTEELHRDNAGLLLGSRDFSQENVPPKSRMGNRITSGVFLVLYGHWVRDTQTGLRGFARELLPKMLEVRGDRYEYEMNMLIEAASLKLPIRALPIETVYENNNEGSHFRAFRDSARIYGVIFGGFFRFISTSAISFGADYGLYLLFNNLLRSVESLNHEFRFLFIQFVVRIALATVLARLCSGVLNFFLNKKFVFENKNGFGKTFPRYLCVFFLIMILSAGLTSSMHVWLGWSDNMAKIPVDIALFFLSYYLQRKWVFSKKVKEKTAVTGGGKVC